MKPALVMLGAVAVMYSIRPAATEAIYPRSEQVFKLESECGELREKFDRQYRREHASADLITVTSRYSPVSNRCFVRVQDGSVGDGDTLFDAQTMQMLAYADRIMRPTSPWRYTASIGHAGGTDYDDWKRANDFIERAMQGER